MATLRNKRKLAAVSRETPEITRNSGAQNTLDPELTHSYISQVSEKIKGRVTKKLSKEFSRTESRILGACLVNTWRISSEPTSSDLFRSRSGNIQEQQLRKPRNNGGSFLRRSLPRSEFLFSPFWSFKQPRGRGLSWQLQITPIGNIFGELKVRTQMGFKIGFEAQKTLL